MLCFQWKYPLEPKNLGLKIHVRLYNLSLLYSRK